jgi:hypothetical protein
MPLSPRSKPAASARVAKSARSRRWDLSGLSDLAEKIELTSPHEVGAAALTKEVIEPARNHDWHATCLTHHELCGGGDLIGDRDERHPQRPAAVIERAAKILNRSESRYSDRDVNRASSPSPAEGIRNNYSEAATRLLLQTFAQPPRRSIWILREQHHCVVIGRV